MKTRIVHIDPKDAAPALVRELSAELLRGAVMAYPTETFYGLGAAALSKEAVGRVFRMKKRDPAKALSVIAADLDMVKAVSTDRPVSFRILSAEFWPGPLTLVLKAAAWLPDHLAGPSRSIAVRIPPASWLRALAGELSQPITATSANLAGGGELSDPRDVVELFSGTVEVIVDGGTTPGGAPSTIVDLTGPEPQIIREGKVPRDRILAALGST